MPTRKRGGSWQLDIRHAGRRFQRACPPEVTSSRAAAAYERRVLADLRVGIDPFAQENAQASVASPTIKDYAATFIAEQSVAAGLKASTTKSKRGILDNWIVPIVGARRIDEVSRADFTLLRTAVMTAGCAGKTVNNVLAVLTSIVKFWHDQHDRPRPNIKAGLVKVAKLGRPRFFTDDECDRLVANATGDTLALLLLGMDAGLRMSECRALQWTDIHGNRVTVSRTRECGEADDGEDGEPPPKGWKSRTVKLTPRLAAALARLPRSLHDPHVFLVKCEPLTRRMVGRRFETCRRRAALKRGSFHWLRHTFCTRLAMAGVPARTIQELAGHADLATTAGYMWCAPGATDAAIDLLDRGDALVTSSELRTENAS